MSVATPNINVDFTYYKPINRRQAEFHASKAKHRLLLGGFGSGKTYPAIHEVFFHCLENPGHNFLVFRNTWDSVSDNIEKEMVEVAREAGVLKKFNKTDHDLILINDCTIMFRPLTLSQKILKGYYACGIMFDDPNVAKHQNTIGFLFSRLRDKASLKVKATRFITIFTANWEGKDWLWKTFMKGLEGDKPEGGDDKFAYWILPTDENPTLGEDYISNMEMTHSKEWMDRYVYMKNMEKNIGLIYYMVNRKTHHMSKKDMPLNKLAFKIRCIDTGLGITCIYKMGTDRKNIYIWGEKYEKGWESGDLGLYLQKDKKKFLTNRDIIDPSSARKEQTSGTSVKADLKRNYKVNTVGADNDVMAGIRSMKDFFKPALGKPRIFIDFDECPKWVYESERYRWKEPNDSDFDELQYKEEPVKKDDHAMDATRYGHQFLKKYIIWNFHEKFHKDTNTINYNRKSKLPFYQQSEGGKSFINTRSPEYTEGRRVKKGEGRKKSYSKIGML